MESVFRQRIGIITNQILSDNYDYDAVTKELEGHLKRARKLSMQVYEAQTLNCMGIFHLRNGDQKQHRHFMTQGLEIAHRLEHSALVASFSNNLAGAYMRTWEVEKANEIYRKAIDLVEREEFRTLPALYIYANHISISIHIGQFDYVIPLYKTAWQICESIDLQGQSKAAYAYIVVQLHHSQAMHNMAISHHDSAMDRLQLASWQLDSGDLAGKAELEIENQRVRLYHALIVEKDEAKAESYRQKIDQAVLESNPLDDISTASYLHHTQQLPWARRYAQKVLNYASAHPELPDGFVSQAKAILTQQ